MKNIEAVANAVLLMDKQLREELLIKDGIVQAKKLWENTYIKKQIDKRENGGTFTVSDHIRAMVYSMLTSEGKWDRFEKHTSLETGQIIIIDKIFCHYDPDVLLKLDPVILANKIMAEKLGNRFIKNQMYALIDVNIHKLLDIENKYGCIDTFYKLYEDNDKTLKALIKELSAENKPYKLVQLGEALTPEYLRNVGYNICKPDRHICRILGSNNLGCSDNETLSVEEAFDIVAEIAKVLNKRTAEVDYILWSYCADGYGKVCILNGTAEDNCSICVANNICTQGQAGVDRK